LIPLQERRRQYEERPGLVRDILYQGSELAAARAEETMQQVRTAMHLIEPEDGGHTL
jgi:tryptophanyl-tRNA synthetase